MPTVTTVTVKSSGGDYTSLSSAEAGEQANLVTADVQLDIECYSFEDTTAVQFLGWTTDATRYIRVYTPTAERHAGVWNTVKYRLVVSNALAITVNEDFVRFEGLQVQVAANSANNQALFFFSSINVGGEFLIDACILRQVGGATFSEPGILVNDADASVTIRNTIAYGGGTAGTDIATVRVAAGTANIDNCTLAGNDYSVSVAASATATVRNTYAAAAYVNAGTLNLTTCAHGTAGVFTGSTASIAHDTTNFTNVTAGSEDYHLVSGADATLKTGGTDLSGTFTTDIDGETRSDWSIGADEIVAAGGLSIPIAMYHYMHHICGCFL